VVTVIYRMRGAVRTAFLPSRPGRFGAGVLRRGREPLKLPRNRRELALWLSKRFRRWLPERTYRALRGYGRLGYVPDYDHPTTFNEKVTWWIRHTRDPRLVERADKLAVRDFVRAVAPWISVPEVYAVAEEAAAFPFGQLPIVSVLKANHGWNQHLVLRRPFDEDVARTQAARWLAQRHGADAWEWHFLAIPPRVYAEAYLGTDRPPTDYKVLVLNGRAHSVQVLFGRGERLRSIMFDRDWRPMSVHRPHFPGGPADVVEPDLHPPRPHRLEEMLAAAEALAEDLPFVRADFYLVDDQIYFGELTFFPAAGYVPFEPVSFDRELGALLELRPDVG
jgi:hypothetical protein